MSVTDILRKVPLFGQLAPPDLDRVAEIARERSYPRNSVILFEDDPGDALYVVAQGQVKVVLIGEDGREVILSVMGEGEFFGEMALIDDEPRSAHVIAMEDSSLLVIRREDFQDLLQADPRDRPRRCCASCPAGCGAWTRRSAAWCCSTSTGAWPQLLLDLADEAGHRPHHQAPYPPHHCPDDRRPAGKR